MKHYICTDTDIVASVVKGLYFPQAQSHKGQNGRLLVVGGSELFHGSLIWAAEVASRLVDMVHVASPAKTNDQLMRYRLKERFWNGIVVPWDRIDDYIREDDVILIGPGMPRAEGLEPGEVPTKQIVDDLLTRFPEKRWVIDGGALQEVEPALLTGKMIITPHRKEWERLSLKSTIDIFEPDYLSEYSKKHGGLTILLKGPVDTVVQGDEVTMIEGGNAGMTKGGTGDVLAGLVAALATMNDTYPAAVAASLINKRAGDDLFERQHVFFNASDLVAQIPQTLRLLLQ